jgi:hypothetical protein
MMATDMQRVIRVHNLWPDSRTAAASGRKSASATFAPAWADYAAAVGDVDDKYLVTIISHCSLIVSSLLHTHLVTKPESGAMGDIVHLGHWTACLPTRLVHSLT